MATDLTTPHLTPAEYLRLERSPENQLRHEWIDGELREMNGAKREHNLLSSNLNGLLWQAFRTKPNEVYPGDMRVRVPDGAYYYPDVVVAGVPPRMEDDEFDTLLNPVLVVEILSPSTESIDRGEKLERYSRIETLTDYLLVAQDRMRVDHYHREAGQTGWNVVLLTEPDADIVLPGLDVRLAIGDTYERVLERPAGD